MRAMIETEQRLECAADRLTDRARHGLPAAMIRGAITAAGSKRLILGPEQEAALRHITGERDLAIVVGYAGTGKSAMLGVARDGWERAGYHVVGTALRSEEHTSELQSLMRISYAVFCLKKKTT